MVVSHTCCILWKLIMTSEAWSINGVACKTVQAHITVPARTKCLGNCCFS